MNSPITIVSRKNDAQKKIADQIGADIVEKWPDASPGIEVLLLDLEFLESSDLVGGLVPFFKTFTPSAPNSRVILVGQLARSSSLDLLVSLSPTANIFSWSENFQSSDLNSKILGALSEARELRQSTESLALFHQHNLTLQRLSSELEERILARRRALEESTARLHQSQRRNDVLHRALVAVHLSQTIAEIEMRLGKTLKAPLDAPHVDWVKVALTSLSGLEAVTLSTKINAVVALPVGNIGHVYFGRAPDKPFRADDRTFLTPIAEAVSLAVTRLQMIERMDLVRREWEETFNSISDAVAVIDEHLNVVRGNRALIRDRKPETIIGRPCFEVVFNRTQPCPACPLSRSKSENRGRIPESSPPQTFRIEEALGGSSKKVFEVSSRPVQSNDPFEPPLLVHLYRDDTVAARFEKRITESAKMAELGTIGSSIAHQLNNPIGGMLSLIQLLLMDLDGKPEAFAGAHELRDELREMEKGTRRCAQIVKDLLGFTRRGIEDAPGEHDIVDIVQQAVKITELQTRSRGVRFEIHTEKADSDATPLIVVGRFNLLAQAIRAVLLAMVSEKQRDRAIVIRVHLDESAKRVEVNIRCDGETTHPDLTIAREIIAEHTGQLELTSPVSATGPVQEARFHLPIKSLTAKI